MSEEQDLKSDGATLIKKQRIKLIAILRFNENTL